MSRQPRSSGHSQNLTSFPVTGLDLTQVSWSEYTVYLRNKCLLFSALMSIRHSDVRKFAFSSLRFWQMAGFMFCYYFSRYLCNRYVIYASIVTVTFAMVTYIMAEIRLKLKEHEVRHSVDSHYKLQDIDGATWIPTLNPLKQRQRSALITLPSQQ